MNPQPRRLRVTVAGIILLVTVLLEGLWIFVAIGIGGNNNGWLDKVILGWWILAISMLAYLRWPWVTLAASVLNLVLCVPTFRGDGDDFLHNPSNTIYRHFFDLVIIAAVIVGYSGNRMAKPENT